MCVCVCVLVDGARDAGAIIVASCAGAQWRHSAQRSQAAAHNAVAIVAAVVARWIAAGTEACVVVGITSAGAAEACIVVGQRIGIGVVATQSGSIAAQGRAIVAQSRAVAAQRRTVASQSGAIAAQGTGAIVSVASGTI